MELDGDNIGLIIQLQRDPDQGWALSVDGSFHLDQLPLQPMTLVVRLWRARDGSVVRGTLQLHGHDRVAPLQSNGQLEAMVRAWLGVGPAGKEQPVV